MRVGRIEHPGDGCRSDGRHTGNTIRPCTGHAKRTVHPLVGFEFDHVAIDSYIPPGQISVAVCGAAGRSGHTMQWQMSEASQGTLR